jgi:hypothetical protein
MSPVFYKYPLRFFLLSRTSTQDKGIEGKYFGLITAVSMERLRVVKKNKVTAFITIGVKNHNQKINAGTINIILHLEANLQDSALINAVITATEAKSTALIELGYDFTGTSTDEKLNSTFGLWQGTGHIRPPCLSACLRHPWLRSCLHPWSC